jgi:hypothetical protein
VPDHTRGRVAAEEVLLLTYEHQPAGGPYAASGPIFFDARRSRHAPH